MTLGGALPYPGKASLRPSIILGEREALRKGLPNFDPVKVPAFTERYAARLMGDPGIAQPVH